MRSKRIYEGTVLLSRQFWNGTKFLGWSLVASTLLATVITAGTAFLSNDIYRLNREVLVTYDNANLAFSRANDLKIAEELIKQNPADTEKQFVLQLAREAYVYFLLLQDEVRKIDRAERSEHVRRVSEVEINSPSDYYAKVEGGIGHFVNEKTWTLLDKVHRKQEQETLAFALLYIVQGINLLIAIRYTFITLHAKKD